MKVFLISIIVGLFVSYISTLLCHSKISKYVSSLDQNLLKKYDNIKKQRLLIFILGLIISIIFAIIYYFMSKESILNKILIVLIIILLLPMIIYMIIPKSSYLLENVSREINTKEWFNVYLCMKNAMIYGFLIAFFATLIILYVIQLSIKK